MGAVQSILLISKLPFGAIRRLACDTNSRTSVALARIILARQFGVEPELEPMGPDLDAMLAHNDAALLIGDAALSTGPRRPELAYLDLGEAWTEMTGLPMVYAMWSGPDATVTQELTAPLQASYEFGLTEMERIIDLESASRCMPRALVDEYLRRRMVYRLESRELAGLDLYLRYATELDGLDAPQAAAHGERIA